MHDFFVKRRNRLGVIVVFDVECLPKIYKLLGNPLDEFGGRDTRFRRRLLDFLAVLIGAGQKKNLLAFKLMIARDDVGQHFFVSVTDMRRRIRVIDRRCDVKRFRHANL